MFRKLIIVIHKKILFTALKPVQRFFFCDSTSLLEDLEGHICYTLDWEAQLSLILYAHTSQSGTHKNSYIVYEARIYSQFEQISLDLETRIMCIASRMYHELQRLISLQCRTSQMHPLRFITTLELFFLTDLNFPIMKFKIQTQTHYNLPLYIL